jgi:hypothetical protein
MAESDSLFNVYSLNKKLRTSGWQWAWGDGASGYGLLNRGVVALSNREL